MQLLHSLDPAFPQLISAFIGGTGLPFSYLLDTRPHHLLQDLLGPGFGSWLLLLSLLRFCEGVCVYVRLVGQDRLTAFCFVFLID